MAKGKLPLNDLAGGAGRMDVLIRALMSSILTSHGMRENVEFTMILLGGPGPARRIRFVSNEFPHPTTHCILPTQPPSINYFFFK